ncbi:MAG: penicillin-binding protein 2 [Thermomicrobiales bacterium]
MTYHSPYSSHTSRRARRAPLWPKLLGVLIVLTILVAGGLVLYQSGFRLSLARLGVATSTAALGATPTGAVAASSGTPVAPGNANGAGALPPTATIAGTPAGSANGTPAFATPKGDDMRSIAQAFVDRWNAKDYSGMYDLISSTDQAGIARDKFTSRYEGIAQEAGLIQLKATLGTPPRGANEFPVHVEMQSSLVGPITDDNTIPMRQDNGAWRVGWTPSLIFKDLGDGLIRYQPDIPQRGRILDRKGRVLAQEGLVDQIGVVPGQIQNEPQFLDTLSKALGVPSDVIKAKYAKAQPDWFVPVKVLPDPLPADLDHTLKTLPGIAVRKVQDRVYPQGTLAAHIVGYMTEVSADELKTLAAKGYIAGDRIGRAGIEAWGEQYLAGKKGGQLTIIDPNDSKVRKVIAQRKSEPSGDITLTIDLDLQKALEDAMGDRASSGVILDPASGGIIAMASHPTFDPNSFILGIDDKEWARLNDEQLRPLWGRATQFVYPSGSIFKVVTATAAVEALGDTPDTVIPCPATYSLPGAPNVWRDWTYPNAQGDMTLTTAITRSCDTVFYELGKELDDKDPNILPTFARKFGLGSPTGLQELPEAAGTVPDPKWKHETLNDGWATGDAINFAIGQGFFLATPLQMANLYNAIANGGTLLRPFLAAKVTLPDGKVVYAGARKELAKLPTSPTSMNMIHKGMYDVINAPNGTAVAPFVGSPIVVAGKTGTAEVPPNADHAWFASFAPADTPKITVLTMVEHGGAGSQVAAPVARHVYDVYAALGQP